jgi:hypothetical protein
MRNINIIFKSVALCLTLSASAVAVAQQPTDAQCIDYLSSHYLSPKDYVVQKFADHDIVMLSEDHHIKENLLLVQRLVPDLYKNGVYNIGMEFGASEDQARLDSLVNAPRYDENVARQMMFDYNCGWAFKEYMDVYRAAWQLNHSLPKGAKKFRVVNLSYIYNWKGFTGKQRTPENMQRVFYRGNTEVYRTGIVEKEIISRGEKILILTGTIHAFTHFRQGHFDYFAPGYARFDNGYFGNLLYDKYPNKVFSISFHNVAMNYPDKTPMLVTLTEGRIERLMKQIGNRPIGFDLKGSPLGLLPDSSSHSMGYKNFHISQIYDGYVFIKPIHELSGCTIDPMFLTKDNWQRALDNMPDPDWLPAPATLEEYMQRIKDSNDIKRNNAHVDE